MFMGLGPKGIMPINSFTISLQRQQWSEIVNEFIGAGGRGIFLEQKFQAVGERLQQTVRADAMWSPAGLNVGDYFALEPGEIGVDGQHYEKKNADLC